MEFRQILQKLMKERTYSNYRLAKEIGCSQTTVSNWLKGINIPQALMYPRIADVFGVSVEYLKGETDDRGEIKKAPTENGERAQLSDGARSALMADARVSVMLDMFQKLSVEDQNDVIFQLLLKTREKQDPDDRK